MRMTHREIYQYAMDGLASNAERMRHLSSLAFKRGDMESADKYDKKRKEYADKISWLENELHEGV